MVCFSPSSCVSRALRMKPRVLSSTSCLNKYSNLSSYSLMLCGLVCQKQEHLGFSKWCSWRLSSSGMWPHSLAKASSCHIFTVGAWVRFQACPRGTLGGQYGVGTSFSMMCFDFPLSLSFHHCFTFIHSSYTNAAWPWQFPAFLGGARLPIPLNEK
jgi:hypothetical protein